MISARRFFTWCVVASMSIVVPVQAAEPVCYTWTRGGQTNTDPVALANAQKPADVAATNNGGGATYSVSGCSPSGPPTALGQQSICQIQRTQTPPVLGGCESYPSYCTGASNYATLTMTSITRECPPDPCLDTEGQEQQLSGDGSSVPDTACHQGCGFTPVGVGAALGGIWVSKAVGIGQSCPDITPTSAGANCISGAGGRVCASKPGSQCGTINGEMVCLDNVPEGNCMLLAGGGAICSSTAGTPPAPTTSDGETPATPDATLTNTSSGTGGGGSTTNNYNYYGNGTVGSSGSPVTGAGNGDGPDGEGEGEEPGEEPEACEGVEECVGGLGELEGIEGSTSAFMARVEGSPLVSAVSGIGSSIPAGECPAPSFEAFGQTLTLSAMCETIDPVLPIISAVMLFVWGVFAVRILMSA